LSRLALIALIDEHKRLEEDRHFEYRNKATSHC
jgi:hypothetical protein